MKSAVMTCSFGPGKDVPETINSRHGALHLLMGVLAPHGIVIAHYGRRRP